MTSVILVTGSILARPDTIEEVRRLGIEHCERSRQEDGCISHDVHTDCQNLLRLFFFERWRDEAALRAHFAVPESRAFVRALKGLLDETTGARIFRAEEIAR